MVDDLLPVARAFRPDLLVHEPAELAAPLVAAVLDVPCVTHSWGQAVPASVLAGGAEAVAATWSRHDLSVPEDAGLFRDGYLDLCPPAVQYVDTRHITGAVPLRPVGYSWPDTGPPALTLGSSASQPLVYVTLGTVFSDTGVLQAAVDAAAGAGARVVAAVGPHLDPGVIDRANEHVHVLSWVPQSALLPETDLVVSHAGSGTFLGALAHGLPQLCLPQAADQFRNAHAATSSGAGLALSPDEVTPGTLAEALRELLEHDDYRSAAARVAGEIAAMPHPSQVAEALAHRFA
jgi:UDP:flavonoid glycosyltransferase YjiC (YdhE family)